MTDIHNHLLFGIDDGSRSIEESVEVLRGMYEYGYRNVILTPHYIKDSNYSSNVKNNYKLLKQLKDALYQNNIDIKLFLGNEIYIDDDIYDLLRAKEIYSLNATEYLLIELPFSGEYPNYEEIFKDLMSKGCKIILAHPERYLTIQKNFDIIYDLEKMGVYFQSNLDSLLGKYGEKAKITLKKLLKEKKVAFLATDIHHKKKDYKVWDEAKQIALKYVTEKEYNYLVNKNPSKLVN